MSNNDRPEAEEHYQLLIEHDVPKHIAKEATTEDFNQKATQRQIWTFLALMLLLTSGVTAIFLVLTEEVCETGAALNRVPSMLAAMCAAMCASGVAMSRLSLRASSATRKSYFIGGFNNPNNLPYLKALIKSANKSTEATLNFDAYDLFITQRSLVWFQWPLYTFIAISVLSFFLVPANCP